MKTLKDAIKTRRSLRRVLRPVCPECGHKYRYSLYSTRQGDVPAAVLPSGEVYWLKIACECRTFEIGK